MSLLSNRRDQRFHLVDRPEDERSIGERDRDRILYTHAFRRLAGITQVASPYDPNLLHNRLTHTLEVAQIGRSLAKIMIQEHGAAELRRRLGGLDSDRVEAAALAHDLGHPPFGHVAEKELQSLAQDKGLPDGFEGNAQSFRIVTKLEVRHQDFPGLNLSRATLNGILKYPWLRSETGDRSKKWGAYQSESDVFEWARHGSVERNRSAEAELMDLADDIAYAVHDLDDFYRAGLIPLEKFVQLDGNELDDFFSGDAVHGVVTRLGCDKDSLAQAFTDLVMWMPTYRPYDGTPNSRALLRRLTANLINRYISSGVELVQSPDGEWSLQGKEWAIKEIEMLKSLTFHYVVHNPSLATQQYGQRHIIRSLFDVFIEGSNGTTTERNLFPVAWQEAILDAESPKENVRAVVDLIASMTEQQAVDYHRRITGTDPGSHLILPMPS